MSERIALSEIESSTPVTTRKMTDRKNMFFFITSSVMFITGLSLLCWDIRLRSLDVDSLEDGRTAANNIDVISDAPVYTVVDTITASASNETRKYNGDTDIPTAITETTTSTTEKNNVTRSGAKCLTFEQSFDNLVASSSSIFLTMPAKAAGFSLQDFTKKCVGGDGGGSNPLNESEKRENIFFSQLTPPKIHSSHIYSDDTMIDLFQNVPRRSLIVYLHRNENDRLLSAIRQVVIGACKSTNPHPMGVNIERHGSRCVLDERQVVDNVIKKKSKEIQMGNSEIMTCDFYSAIEDNFPRMVFLHYKRADDLQNVIAKYHCPKLVGHPIRINTEEDKKYIQPYLKLEDGQEVELNEWMEAKRDLLELTFQLKAVDRGTMTCQAQTRSMEDELFGCEDEILEITRDTSF